jgi:hypothetical protein
MDSPGPPLGLVVLVIIVLPCTMAVFFGLFAFRNMTALAFRCLQCDAEFRRKPWHRFARRCPSCGSSDWNVPPQ